MQFGQLVAELWVTEFGIWPGNDEKLPLLSFLMRKQQPGRNLSDLVANESTYFLRSSWAWSNDSFGFYSQNSEGSIKPKTRIFAFPSFEWSRPKRVENIRNNENSLPCCSFVLFTFLLFSTHSGREHQKVGNLEIMSSEFSVWSSTLRAFTVLRIETEWVIR